MVGELVDLTVHNSLHIVGGVIDSMIGDAGLRKIVGANLLLTVSRSHERLALGRVAILCFALRDFEELGAENLEA